MLCRDAFARLVCIICGRYYRRSDKQECAKRMKAGIIDPEVPDLLQHCNAGRRVRELDGQLKERRGPSRRRHLALDAGLDLVDVFR